MKKNVFLQIFILIGFIANAQFANSWIDYSKTYYKFKITSTGVTRINQPELLGVGLGSTPANQFQLFRNGVQVRLFTSTTGVLPSAGYIEFFGEINDGIVDSALYETPNAHLNKSKSLYSDSATYYLTTNAIVANNLRFVNGTNNTQGNFLSPEPYCLRTKIKYFDNIIGLGKQISNFSITLYRSIYDRSEGYTSSEATSITNDFTEMGTYKEQLLNNVSVTFSVGGLVNYARNIRLTLGNPDTLNQITYTGAALNFYNSEFKTVNNISNLKIGSLSNRFNIQSTSTFVNPPDKIVAGMYSITYPAYFNAFNSSNFEFTIQGDGNDKYIEVSNFNNNGQAPLLYNLITGEILVGDITITSGKIAFLLPSFTGNTNYRLLNRNTTATPIQIVSSLTTKNFVNYSIAANQGNYLIISNKLLENDGTGVNQVNEYKNYRSTLNGGNYNAKIYDIDELTEQFAFGIYRHPLAIKNFIKYSLSQFATTPKHAFLIGHGLTYINFKGNIGADLVNNEKVKSQHLLPTWGFPASDILMVATNPSKPYTNMISIGRLSAIKGIEIKNYLDKVKTYELRQTLPANNFDNKLWQKNIINVAGGATILETNRFIGYLNSIANANGNTNGISDTTSKLFYGGRTFTYFKTTDDLTQINSEIPELFKEGIGLLNYFGHSSASTLEFNLNNPNLFDSENKYPFVNVSGCNAGNIFNYQVERNLTLSTIGENYVFSPKRGSIGFLASSYLGLENYLQEIKSKLFQRISKTMYGKTIGEQLLSTTDNLSNTVYIGVEPMNMHLEQTTLQGDPAIVVNAYPLPDYNIEEKTVKISPSIISVADQNFNVSILLTNLGKATTDSLRVSVHHRLPDNTISVLFDRKVKPVYNRDSLNFTVVLDRNIHKGLNKIEVRLDPLMELTEITEDNNNLVKEFFVLDNQLTPLYPYKYGIVNVNNFKFAASTVNPISGNCVHTIEVDTTEFFNSPLKKEVIKNSFSGLVEFDANQFNIQPNIVYYWRTKSKLVNAVDENNWVNSTFIYLTNTSLPANNSNGFNQSHFYQYDNNKLDKLILNPTSQELEFQRVTNIIDIRNLTFGGSASAFEDFGGFIDGERIQKNYYSWVYGQNNGSKACVVLFNKSKNRPIVKLPGSFNNLYLPNPSNYEPVDTRHSYEFLTNTPAERNKLASFLELIPNETHVTIKNISSLSFGFSGTPGSFVQDWINDPIVAPNTANLYNKFLNLGFTKIDSFYKERAWIFIYKKGATQAEYPTRQVVSDGTGDKVILTSPITGYNVTGTMLSEKMGPSSEWNTLSWSGYSKDAVTTNDRKSVKIYGIKNDGVREFLRTVFNTGDTTISFISAATYPYLQLELINYDSLTATPFQLSNWRLLGKSIAEGALDPNTIYSLKDSVEQGEAFDFKIGFKNVSHVSFDSLMKARMSLTNSNNITTVYNFLPRKVIAAGDSLYLQYKINTDSLAGNLLFNLILNPDKHQNEMYSFNNIFLKNIFVKKDQLDPLLDVTFDGTHIMNNDITSSLPNINIKLKDESKFLALKDTSSVGVKLYKLPDENSANNNEVLIPTSYITNMRFFPATNAAEDNSARVELKPTLEDGTYRLIVKGKDGAENTAGQMNYNVLFKVINKPMISNLLNYPNPFSTSTQFVFTLTGATVPESFRIQILTVTGKVVKEITKEELTDIHIGNNITNYKWNGTDMFGNRLANGVYLYRVITKLNGNNLEKYDTNSNIDKSFKSGYGKMYLMK